MSELEQIFDKVLKESQGISEIGTLKDIAEKFHKVATRFLKIIKPLCSLNESHKLFLLEAARGESDYNEFLIALDELNMSIYSFSQNYRNIGNDPQRFVDYVIRWINNIIDSMYMIRNYASEESTSKEDLDLFEKAKKSYEECMISSKNLYNLLDAYNISPNKQFTFDLSNWPTKYF